MRFAVSLAATFFIVSAAASTSCRSAVNDLAPASLRTDGVLHSVCTPVTVDGRKLLAVAYSNGGGGHLAVVTDETVPVVVARSSQVLFDIAQAIELHDFTGDGRPELVVKFVSRNDVLSWVFAYDSAQGLRLLSPALDDDDSPLANADIVDVDNDGRSEIVTVSVVKETDGEGSSVAHPSYRLYYYRDGQFRPAADRQVFRYASFVRAEAKPRAETVDVHVPRPGVYRLTLLNGVSGLGPCTSGEMTVNGTPVLRDSDFKKALRTSTIDLQLQFDNIIETTLKSAPTCAVAFIIDQPLK